MDRTPGEHLVHVVTREAKLFLRLDEHIPVPASVRFVTGLALPLGKGRMEVHLFRGRSQVRMADEADLFLFEQGFPVRGMGVVASGTLSFHNGTVRMGQIDHFLEILVAREADGLLVLLEEPLLHGAVRGVTPGTPLGLQGGVAGSALVQKLFEVRVAGQAEGVSLGLHEFGMV